MKIIRLLPILLILVFVLPATVDNGIAYIPDPEEKIISMGMMSSHSGDIFEGTIVEIFVLIKNFSNETLNNVTITQTIQSSLTFIETPYKDFNGTDMEYTENVSIRNLISNSNISLNYFKISKSNFSLNMDKIDNGEEIRIRFSVNVTEATSSNIVPTSLVYFDKYGDLQPAISPEGNLFLNGVEKPECEKCDYFENVEVDDMDWVFILSIAVAILLAGLLSRSLYNKKPIG